MSRPRSLRWWFVSPVSSLETSSVTGVCVYRKKQYNLGVGTTGRPGTCPCGEGGLQPLAGRMAGSCCALRRPIPQHQRGHLPNSAQF